jgi:diphthine-ammonia ligase
VEGGFASVYFLRIRKAELIEKSGFTPELQYLKEVITPPLLGEFASILNEIIREVPVTSIATSCHLRDGPKAEEAQHTIVTTVSQNWLCISNIHSSLSGRTISLKEETERCFAIVKGKLDLPVVVISNSVSYGPTEQLLIHRFETKDVVNINLALSSIDDFVSINHIYRSYFRVAPPARTCVAVNLLNDRRIEMEVLAYKPAFRETYEQFEKRALQVQSLSYWAPAVIGPYSQAIMVRCSEGRYLSN